MQHEFTHTPAPVSDSGDIDEIIIGDDYLAAYGRAFEFTVDAPSGFVAGTSVTKFGGRAFHRNTSGAWLVTGSITDNGATWTLSFDMPRATTGALTETEYRWSVEVVNADGTERTVVGNRKPARAKSKQT